MLTFAVLAILSLAGFTGGVSAQPLTIDISCVGPPNWEALHPSGLYFTYGPGTFGRDITSPAAPYATPGALTIIGDSSWKLSRWMTQTTAIGDGCYNLGFPPVHGGGYVTVAASMRTLNVPGYANISLTYWDKNVQYIGSASSSNLKGTTDWTPMSVSGVTPDGTKYIRIEYLLSGPGEVWIGGTWAGGDYASITYPYPSAVNVTPPSVAGFARVGQLLTANPGTWEDGASAGYSFNWYRCNAAGQNCVLIPDAGGYVDPNGPDPPGQYTVRPDDVGSTLRVAVKLIAEERADFVMSAPTAAVTSAGEQQLAPDPGFEVDPGPFYFTDGPCGFSWATDASHSPTHALKISTTTSMPCRWMSETRAISATPGTSYNVSVWLKTLGTASVSRLSVNFWDRAETYIPATVDAPVSIHGPQDWTQLSLRVTAPANAAFLRVEFRLNGPGTLWVDDVAVAGPAPPTVTILDTLGAATPDSTFRWSGGQGINANLSRGARFTLTAPTAITEIGAFINGGKCTPGVPEFPNTFPFVIRILGSVNGLPDPSTVLATRTLPRDDDPLVFSYERVSTDIALRPGTYFAMFSVQSADDCGVLLGGFGGVGYVPGDLDQGNVGPSSVNVERLPVAERILGVVLPTSTK